MRPCTFEHLEAPCVEKAVLPLVRPVPDILNLGILPRHAISARIRLRAFRSRTPRSRQAVAELRELFEGKLFWPFFFFNAGRCPLISPVLFDDVLREIYIRRPVDHLLAEVHKIDSLHVSEGLELPASLQAVQQIATLPALQAHVQPRDASVPHGVHSWQACALSVGGAGRREHARVLRILCREQPKLVCEVNSCKLSVGKVVRMHWHPQLLIHPLLQVEDGVKPMEDSTVDFAFVGQVELCEDRVGGDRQLYRRRGEYFLEAQPEALNSPRHLLLLAIPCDINGPLALRLLPWECHACASHLALLGIRLEELIPVRSKDPVGIGPLGTG
mmetsp:Transcript_43320/g.119823  ORF Transcript_43320/g.119823 Transcript_43320/m.119823 type:complete len:330 (+) Transcript_43320:186-1175(+)